MDDKNLKGLYDTLKKDGYNPPEYDTFKNDMQDDKNLQGAYNTLKKEGYTPPEYNVFRQDMFSSAQRSSTEGNGSVSQQVINEYDKSNLPQSKLSPYVRGKGANVEIFGVPLSAYNNMSPEEQSRTYSEAITHKKQEEKNVFSNYISSQLGEIDGELNQRQEAVAPATGSAFIPSSAVAAVQRFGNSDNKEAQDRYTSLHAAKNLLDDASKIAEEAKKGDTNFFSGLGRGFKDKFTDADNWTMGLTDTAYSGLLKNAVEKEEHGEELSPEESKLLDAAAVNMATQAYFSSEMGRGYKAGSMTAESIPFMLEFAVNPISSTGNVLAKGLLKYGLKRFGRAAASNVSKIAGRLVGDAVAAAGMTATSGLGRVAAGANERMIGDIQSTVKDGEIKYDGRENGMEAGEAYFKSTTSNFLEYQSEMVFNAFAGGGKMAKEALGKFIPGFSKLSNSEIAQFIGRISNNPAIKNIAKRTQFHGMLGEYAEEVYNNFANIPLGEMSVEQATDLDQNIDTFLGLAPTSVAFGLFGLGGMVRESYESKRNLRRFNEGLSQEDRNMFGELQQVIDAGDKETSKAFIKRTINDKDLTQEEKKVRVFAVQDMAKAKAVEEMQSPSPAPEEIEANKVDVYRNYKRAERKINSLIPANIIPQLDGMMDVEQFAHDNNLNDNQAMAVSDYLSAKQPYNQYEEQTNKRKEEAKVMGREAAIAQLDGKINQETGYVVQAKMFGNDKPVYLTGGNLVFGDDGILDKEKSTERIYYFDESKNTPIPAKPDKFDALISINSPEEIIAKAETDAELGYETTEKESLRTPEIPDPRKGEEATVRIGNNNYLVEVNSDNPDSEFLLTKLTPEGELDVEAKDGKFTYPISVDKYYDLKEAELWGESNNPVRQNSSLSQMPSKVLEDGRLAVPSAVTASEVVYDVLDANGNITDSGMMSSKEFNSLTDYASEREEELNDDGNLVNPLPVENVESENTLQNESIPQNEESNVSETEPLTEETPEQRKVRVIDSLPKKKDGKMDYDAFTPQQQYDYTSVTDSEESAANDLAEDISEREKQLNKMNEQLSKATGIKKVKLRDAIREHKSSLDELNTFYKQVATPASFEQTVVESEVVEDKKNMPEDLHTDEDYINWISENSEDAKELSNAYSAAKELASHEQTLKPWQRELLGRKIRPDSFNRFGDRNNITGGLAKAWLRKDGEEIDTLAQELSTFGGEVTEQDVIDFIVNNPGNRVSQVSQDMRNLSKRFSEIATREMGVPVAGPESTTGKLYVRLKEANQKLAELSEQQRTEVEDALSADMEATDEQRAKWYNDSLDDYAAQYDQFRNEIDEEAADEAIIQEIEASEPELYHGGFTAEELDDIYSQIENNNGTERQAENSGENQPSLSGEEIERSQEPGISVVAGAENNENEREDRIAEVGETESIGVPVGHDNSENNQENEDVAASQEGIPVDTVPVQDTIAPQEEQPSFISPVINPGENVLDYAGRIASEKEEYDGRSVADINSTRVQVDEVVPESEMTSQEESVHIEEGNKVIENTQATLTKIAEEREEVNQAPTEAQKKAGNYKKGHVKVGGYSISIESPKGSERSGVDTNGQSWSVTMNNDYGYIRGTESVDGDHIDMFLSDFPDQGNVFVVDQVKEDGSFDEHKVMYGFSSVDEAKEAYLANYSPGWKGLGIITEVSKEGFKKWIDSSKRKTKPFTEYTIAKTKEDTKTSGNTNFPISHVGNSGMIVNEDGTPMTLYHGTTNKGVNAVTELEPGHKRDDGDKASFNGSGVSFTPHESVALDYSIGNSEKVFKGNVVLKNPYYSYGVLGLNENEAEGYSEKIKSEGHDGIIVYASPMMRNIGDSPTEVVVFSKDGIVDINDDSKGAEANNVVPSRDISDAVEDGRYKEEKKEHYDDIRFREEKDDVSDFAAKHNINEADVRKYAEAMQNGNLGGASYAFQEIRRKRRTDNTTESLRQFSQRFSPVRKELYDVFGNVDELRDEAIRSTMEERNIMEAARTRIKAEEENERIRLQEFQDMSVEQLDGEYFNSIKDNDENRMRDLVNEAARRNGYDSDADFRMSHRAPSYDEEGMDKSMVDIANNKDGIRESLNEQLRMNRDEAKDESATSINEVLTAIDNGEKATVTIYRAVPKALKEGKVRNGDWVTLSEAYANIHGEHTLHGDYRIMKEEVPTENLYWDGSDINEWGYDDRNDYRHKDTKNNRKLNDLITRDDKGHVIPLSERFNSRKHDPRFREMNDVGEPALKWNSTSEELNDEESDRHEGDEKLTVNNVNQEIYDISGPHLSKLYKNGSLGRVLVGDHADINQIKAYREYNSARENLDPLRKKLEDMIPRCTDAARKEVENTISDIDYALDYYKRLYEGEDVWRSAARPRFRILDEQSNTPTEEDGEVAAKIGELVESLHTPVRIARTIADVSDGAAKRAIEKGRNIKGWYDPNTGEVVVYLPNTVSAADAQATILHEAVAHKGLKEMLGEESFNELCGKVFDTLPEDVRNGLLEKHEDRLIAGDEYMASIAESDIEPSLWEKIKSFVREAFRKIGSDLSISDNDIKYLLWKSKNRLMNRDNGMDLVNKMAADAEMKQKLGVSEYGSAQENNSLDKETVEKTIERFDSQVANHPAIHSLYSEEDVDGLSANGIKNVVISELRVAIKSKNIKAAYLPSSNKIVIFPSHFKSENDLESFLWHENTHYILQNSEIENKDRLLDSCLAYVKDEYPDVYSHIKDAYKGEQDVWAEESAAYFMQHLFKEYGAERLLSSKFGGDSNIANLVTHIIAKTKDGSRKEEYNQSGRISKGFEPEGVDGRRKTDLSSYSATKNEVEEDRERREGEAETRGAREKVVRFRYETDRESSDGTIEQYEAELKKKAFRAKEAYQDSMLALKKLQDVIVQKTGKEPKSFEDAYTAENHLSSKSTAEIEFYGEHFFRSIMKEIGNLINNGNSYDDVKRYVFAKHGLERNEVFARRDASNAVIEKFWKKKNVVQRKYDEGKLSKDEYEKELQELQLAEKDFYEQQYEENRQRDYSGLTTLTEDKENYEELAQEIIDEFEQSNDVSGLWQVINSATKETLKKTYESGLINKATYEKVSNQFRYYIPLRGWNEETATDVYEYLQSEVSPVNATMKTAKGRMSLADDPFATIGNMAESNIFMGNRNLMKQRFMNMVLNHPSDVVSLSEAWYVRDSSTGDWVLSTPDIKENDTSDEVRHKIEEHENRMQELAKNGDATKVKDGLNINYRISDRQAREHMVVVKRNGKEYVMYVNGNPRAAQAVNGMTNPDVNEHPVWKWIGHLNRQLASNFTTRNPAFVVTNLSRDLIYSTSSTYAKEGTPYGNKFVANIPKAMKTVIRNLRGKGGNSIADAYFKEYLANGGETGYANLMDVKAYKKFVENEIGKITGKKDYFKYLKACASFFSLMNRWAENVSRFNAYMTSREMGRDVFDSVSEAKEVTVNFNKKGAGYKTKGFFGLTSGTFKELFLFFNAAVQSLNNFSKIAVEHKSGFVKMVGGFTAAGFMIPALNALTMSMFGDGDDDYYSNLPEWVRRNNVCIYMGYGKFLTIPLPIELRAFYGLGEMAYQEIIGNGHGGKQIAYDAINQITDLLPINPLGNNGDIVSSFTPDIAKPVVQMIRNKDYTGKPIYKENSFNEYMPEWTKTYNGTSKWLKNFSEWTNDITGGNKYKRGGINFNPAKVEHLLESYFGGMAKTINQASNTLVAGVESVFDGERSEDLLWRNAPVLNRFINDGGDDRTSFSKVNSRYYNLYDTYKDVQREFNGYKKEISSGNLDYLKELSELQNSKEFEVYMVFEKYRKTMDGLSKLEKSFPENNKVKRKEIETKMMDIKKKIVKSVDKPQ